MGRRRDAARAPASANPARGETTIALEGIRYVMRPSHDAIDEFEQATDRSAKELLDAAYADKLKAREIAAIVGACVRAKGRQDNDPAVSAFRNDRIREILPGEQGGLLLASRAVAVLLLAAVTGGVDSKGFPKPMPTKSPSTSAGTDAGSPA